MIAVDPVRFQDRLVAVPAGRLLAQPGFQAVLADHGVPAQAAPVRGWWYLRLPGGQTVSLAPPYEPVSRRVRPEPVTLLHPEHGLVPFLGRQPLLDYITDWCQKQAGQPVLLVTGGGGSGKTRLGREACVQMLMAGWDAGLADDQRRDGPAMDRLVRPTLLVIDDADLRTDLISALVDYLRRDANGPPVRLLLLARARGNWWDTLLRQQALASAYTTLDLDEYPVPPGDREEHFRRASAAFAAYGGHGAQPADPPPTAELADPAYAEPLLIHIAALLRTMDMPDMASPVSSGHDRTPGGEATAAHPGTPVRQRLLQVLCERERTRWYQLGETHLLLNRDLPLVDQLVALATLTAAADQPSAVSLLAALPNQAEVTRIGAEALAAWAHRLYAGPGYWNPLRPDLLAEQHLADTAQLPALAATAAQLASGQPWEPGLLTQLLAELTRAAPNQTAVQTALGELLAATLPRITRLAVTGGRTGLADLASLGLQLAPQPGLAAQLAEQMPEHSVHLAALAATLASQRVTHYRAGTVDGDPDAADRLAVSLNDLSLRLADVGEVEEALAAIEEAVTIYRELDAADDQGTFQPDLARSLDNLSIRLADAGRLEEALAAGEEAVTIYRELDAADDQGTFQPDLARSLNNLSNQLADVGRLEEALAAGEEAATIYRERPDVFRPDLAMSLLIDLSNRLGDLGRPWDALAAMEEAATIYRELAAADRDTFRPDLATLLVNLSNRLGDVGWRRDALTAIQEAATIYRELAAARPDSFRPLLAKSLIDLAGRLTVLGRREEALAAGEEAVTILRELAVARPDSFRPLLATSLNNLAVALDQLGRHEDALATIEEAVTILRDQAAKRPDADHRDLERSLRVAAWLQHR